jgi:CDP-diacylglycerol--serine O-phosphatidyltransferase
MRSTGPVYTTGGRSRSQRALVDALTCCNLACGVAATLLPKQGNRVRRSTLVLFAALFDTFDGPLARRSGHATELGAAVDGVADLISFGLAPATLLADSAPSTAASTLVPGLYAAASAWRLARYGIAPRTSDVFRGLPLTGAGLILTVGLRSGASSNVARVLALGLAAAMISGIPVPSGETFARRAVRIAARGHVERDAEVSPKDHVEREAISEKDQPDRVWLRRRIVDHRRD